MYGPNQDRRLYTGLGVAPVIVGAASGLVKGISSIFGGNNTQAAYDSRVKNVNDLAAKARAGDIGAYHALGVRAGVPSPVDVPSYNDGTGGGGKSGKPIRVGSVSDWVGRSDRPWKLAQQLYDSMASQYASTAVVAAGVPSPVLKVPSSGQVGTVVLVAGAALLGLMVFRSRRR